jgi:hypothetical protein
VQSAAAAPAAETSVAETAPADDNLNAVTWTQNAIEHDPIFLQTYRDAQSRLLAALRDTRWDALPKDDRTAPIDGLKPAVVLDIDETTLDNSPCQARLIRGEAGKASQGEISGIRARGVSGHIRRSYCVLHQMGDRLVAFVTVTANTPAGCTRAVQPYLSWIG